MIDIEPDTDIFIIPPPSVWRPPDSGRTNLDIGPVHIFITDQGAEGWYWRVLVDWSEQEYEGTSHTLEIAKRESTKEAMKRVADLRDALARWSAAFIKLPHLL